MRKIPTLLQRGADRRVMFAVEPGLEWVLEEPEAVTPTRKWDGTCCAYARVSNLDPAAHERVVRGEIEAGKLEWWARREVKPGRETPSGFILVERDDVTGKRFGWEPARLSPYAKYLGQALNADPDKIYVPGTYELVGPKVNGNPDGFQRHRLVPHGGVVLTPMVGLTQLQEVVNAVRAVGTAGMEGVVWWHADGRMAKLKARDLVDLR